MIATITNVTAALATTGYPFVDNTDDPGFIVERNIRNGRIVVSVWFEDQTEVAPAMTAALTTLAAAGITAKAFGNDTIHTPKVTT